MSIDTIKSKTKHLDAVVRKYAEDIDTFESEVEESMSMLDSSMSRLSGVWAGDLFDDFEEKMKERQTTIRASLYRANKLKEKLNDNANKLAILLKKLEAASKDL